MTTAIVIPARYASSRFPGKPLAPLMGATGISKPLIQRSIEAAREVPGVAHLYVATDDDRIADAARACGAAVAMTPPESANGTERVAAALSSLPDDIDVIINFQGDALLTPSWLVMDLENHMRADPTCDVATVAVRCSGTVYAHLVTDQMQERVGGTTVVCNAEGKALYFSKRVLPHIAPGSTLEAAPPVLLHLGLYAYRRSALTRYAALPPPTLKQSKGWSSCASFIMGYPWPSSLPIRRHGMRSNLTTPPIRRRSRLS
ncbi:cytidylyltransferase domain-containing protein [Sphingobium sp. SCG-1]|uniref:cytidylyltransferase domain-containing protein n=1 Tax=Sphingobium sp. SCG-1 TaxID=2072936 RepID=UPI0026B8915D|nr:NTP transferase domain-containing protein [Sphingobium sp. SCG-1]